MALRPLLVVAGLGTGGGTGAATARLFAKQGFSVALIARSPSQLDNLAKEINTISPQSTAAFPIDSYSSAEISRAFSSIKSHFPSSSHQLRAALYNAGHAVWKPFLDITPADVAAVTQTNIEGAFAFAHEVISILKENPIDEKGKRGTLMFTGATASIRGNVITSAIAAGKHALRALSQSLAKEFGKQNIHVSHAIIDGGILTSLSKERRNDKEWEQNEDVRLNPESIASVRWNSHYCDTSLTQCQAYLYLSQQDRSAWTWELDRQ
jgi:NAD(P)-dependent dehydrogenase (short-subunit alcohol dehydrogenase family)